MADSTQEVVAKRPKTKAGTGAPSSGKTSAASSGKAAPTKAVASSAPETAAPARPSFLSRLTGRSASAEMPSPELKPASKTQATATDGAPATATKPSFLSMLTGRSTGPGGKPAQPGMGRFFFGMSLYMVLALAAQVGLGYLFQVIPGHGAQVLISLPIIGNVTLALFTWMAVLIGILFALYKFNILPRSLGAQQRQKLASVKADPKTARPAPAKPVREPLTGPNDEAYERVKARIRAERRKERRH